MNDVPTTGDGLDSWPVERWLSGVADPVRLAVLRILSEAGRATAAELVRGCQTSRRTLERHLEAMITLGLVEELPGETDGLTTGRPPTRFSLAPQVRASVHGLLTPGQSAATLPIPTPSGHS